MNDCFFVSVIVSIYPILKVILSQIDIEDIWIFWQKKRDYYFYFEDYFMNFSNYNYILAAIYPFIIIFFLHKFHRFAKNYFLSFWFWSNA